MREVEGRREIRGGKNRRESKEFEKTLAIYFQFSKLKSRTFAFLILLIIIKMILLV